MTHRSARATAREYRTTPQPRRQMKPTRPWGWGDVVWVGVTLLTASGLTLFALSNSLALLMPEEGIVTARAILLILFYLMTLVVLAYRAHKREMPFAGAYRLRWNPLDSLSGSWTPWISSLWVAALFFILRLFAIGYTYLTAELGWVPPPSEKLTSLFGTNIFGLVTATISVVLLAPLIEELVFRVVMLETFTQKFSATPAIFLQAAIFSLYHFSLWAAFPNFLLALACAHLAKKSRTTIPAVLLHVLYNAAVVAAAYYTAL